LPEEDFERGVPTTALQFFTATILEWKLLLHQDNKNEIIKRLQFLGK